MWKTHERRVKSAKSCKICIPSTCLTITDTCPWNVLIWKYNSNIFNKRRIWSFIIETNQNLWRCNFKSLNLFAQIVPSHAILLLPSNLYFCTFSIWQLTVDSWLFFDKVRKTLGLFTKNRTSNFDCSYIITDSSASLHGWHRWIKNPQIKFTQTSIYFTNEILSCNVKFE